MSPFAKTAVSTADYLDIDHKRVIISPLKGETGSECFKKINPAGLIPAIKDGEHTMGESIDIAKYFVESRKIQTSFWPLDDKAKQDQIDEDIKFAEEVKGSCLGAYWNLRLGKMLGKTNPTEDERSKFLEDFEKTCEQIEKIFTERKTKYLNCDSKFTLS